MDLGESGIACSFLSFLAGIHCRALLCPAYYLSIPLSTQRRCALTSQEKACLAQGGEQEDTASCRDAAPDTPASQDSLWIEQLGAGSPVHAAWHTPWEKGSSSRVYSCPHGCPGLGDPWNRGAI